jgi:hypothetical protein
MREDVNRISTTLNVNGWKRRKETGKNYATLITVMLSQTAVTSLEKIVALLVS